MTPAIDNVTEGAAVDQVGDFVHYLRSSYLRLVTSGGVDTGNLDSGLLRTVLLPFGAPWERLVTLFVTVSAHNSCCFLVRLLFLSFLAGTLGLVEPTTATERFSALDSRCTCSGIFLRLFSLPSRILCSDHLNQSVEKLTLSLLQAPSLLERVPTLWD